MVHVYTHDMHIYMGGMGMFAHVNRYEDNVYMFWGKVLCMLSQHSSKYLERVNIHLFNAINIYDS